MYKISHRQVFHPNSEPQMCHDLTLQIISYQIKDNMRNHGSIGLLGSWILVGNLAFGCFSLFLFYFFSFFLFGLMRNKCEHKDLVGNQEGDCFTHPSGFNQVLLFLFAFENSTHCLARRTFLYFFFLSFLSIFLFAFLQSLIGWLSSFLYFFSFSFDACL